MQILQTGSFVNLENDQGVEALKLTARRLAEHSTSVITENLNSSALENLANNLWEKAEYVTRETERRRLKEIFTQNFSQRFCELKPEVSEAKDPSFEAESNVSTNNNIEWESQSSNPETIQSGESEIAARENVVSSAVSKEDMTADQEKSDEFLGFVENDNSPGEARAADSEAKMTTAPEEIGQTIAQTAQDTISSTLRPKDFSNADETPTTEDQTVAQSLTTEKSNDTKMPTAANVSQATNSSKNNPSATKSNDSFDFEKCTINLNLTLLPTEYGNKKRKVIIGAASHDLPPEIDFLEIAEGEDLTNISDLVREKLERFKQTLPVKYIEQLRASKTKTAKKTSTKQANTAATQTENEKPHNERMSGEQTVQKEKSLETEKTPAMGETEGSKTIASSDFVPTVTQKVSTNEIQQSLF